MRRERDGRVERERDGREREWERQEERGRGVDVSGLRGSEQLHSYLEGSSCAYLTY